MSVNYEILRLETAKANIKAAIRAYGVTVPDSASISDMHTYIAQIGLLPFDAGLFTEANTATVDAGEFTD